MSRVASEALEERKSSFKAGNKRGGTTKRRNEILCQTREMRKLNLTHARHIGPREANKRTFETLVGSLNPQALIAENPTSPTISQQLEILNTMVFVSTPQQFRQYIALFTGAPMLRFLVNVIAANSNLGRMLALQTLVNITFSIHRIKDDSVGLLAVNEVISAGFFQVATHIITTAHSGSAAEEYSLLTRCIWDAATNIALVCPETLYDLMRSPLITHGLGVSMDYAMKTHDPSVDSTNHLMIFIKHIYERTLAVTGGGKFITIVRNQDESLLTLEFRNITWRFMCAVLEGIPPGATKWGEYVDTPWEEALKCILSASTLLLQSHREDEPALLALFSLCDPSAFFRVLLKIADGSLQGVPHVYREAIILTCSEISAFPTPGGKKVACMLMSVGAIPCIVKCAGAVHSETLRHYTMQWAGNLACEGYQEFVKPLIHAGIIESIQANIGGRGFRAKSSAAYALMAIIGSTYHVEDNDVLRTIVTRYGALRWLSSLLSVGENNDPLLLMDILSILEYLLKWNHEYIHAEMENHGVDDRVSAIISSIRPDVSAKAMVVDDLFHGRDPEMRDAEYIQRAMEIEADAGFNTDTGVFVGRFAF